MGQVHVGGTSKGDEANLTIFLLAGIRTRSRQFRFQEIPECCAPAAGNFIFM